MFEHQNIVISSGDYFILQSLVVPQCRERELLVEMIRRKLDQAIVAFPTDIGPDVVGIGSRVSYLVNDRPEERTLIVGQQRPQHAFLHLLSVHGAALLGLRTGQSFVIPVRGDGDGEVLRIEAVNRPQTGGSSHAEAPDTEAPALREAVRVLPFQPRTAAAPRVLAYAEDDDDPGPSAA